MDRDIHSLAGSWRRWLLVARMGLLLAIALGANPAQAAQATTHVVLKGQTLGGIAQRYGVSLQTLCDANRIQRSSPIRVGQKLKIPATQGRVARKHYTVARGDTLAGIARQHATTIATLTRLNNISRKAPIRAGQRLLVPGAPSRTAERQSARSRAATGAPEKHEVQRGETLSAIAQRYGTSVDAVANANDVVPSRIRSGQVLVIPDKNDSDGSRARRWKDRQGGAGGPSRAPDPGLQRLVIGNGLVAYYYEPTGPGRLALKPVLMYLHGRGGDPAADCTRWARVARPLGWVVCPTGPVNYGGGRRGWGNNWVSGHSVVKAGLTALRAKYQRRVQLYGNTLIGFSEGAFVAMNVGLRETRAFNRWLILAADTEYWGSPGREQLQRRGASVRRVYLITGRRDVVYDETQEVRRWLRKAGIPVRISTPKDMGHQLALESKPSMYRAALIWLERGQV